MEEWIEGRGINGEYGYINVKTGLFRTTLPNSKEEKTTEEYRYNLAALRTHSGRLAKFDETEGKQRNHSDETKKKFVNRPIIAVNPDGTYYNTYVRELAPYENSMQIVSPEFDILAAVAGTGIGEAALRNAYNLYNNVLDLKSLRSFMLRYGYTLILPRNSIIFNNKKLDLVFNHIVNLHNTFTRGVHVPGNLNTKEAKEIGKKYLMEIHHVKDPNRGGLISGEDALYTSNSIGLSQIYTDGNGFIGILRRPIKTGFSTRRLFLQLNDFRLNPIPDNRFSITTDYPKDFPKWTNPIKNTATNNSKRYGKRVPKYDLTPEYLYLVRANAGAYPIKNTNKTDDHFRHYLFIGNEGELPLELIRMYPYKSNRYFNVDYDYTSTGLSHKK